MSLIASILTGGSNNHETTSEEVNAPYTDYASEGVVGDLSNTAGVAPATGGFAVNAQGTPDMTVAVSAGVAIVTATPTAQSSQNLRIKNTASANVTISANSSGSTKYDWVYISISAANAANPNAAGDNVATLTTSRSSSSAADDGAPPTYGYPLAVVTVANGAISITNGNIRDIREESGMTPVAVAVSTASWTSAGATPSSVVANGNRSYSLTWASSILADRSVGMRNKYTRTVTAPTQCTDLESGSSQYYSKSSPAGMTFTDDFVVSAWIKLESYGDYAIAGRYNGTSGWRFYINSSGRVVLQGLNASSANTSEVSSYQSLPLGKWVHVAAQLDMSTFTATTTTSYVMIDGVDVPASVARAGTNPTALIQAGDLQIGAANGALFFDGKLAQVAIYSAKVTQATARASMNQTLSGSETSLISAYSFNNTINDLNTSNANNLTAQGSAVATNADSPFAGGDTLYNTDGTTEYSITTAISSDGLTETVQVPEGYALPTSGGISAVSYSTHSVPYGFPRDKNKWILETLGNVDASAAVNNTLVQIGNLQTYVPYGEWEASYKSNTYMNAGNGGYSKKTLIHTATSKAAGDSTELYMIESENPGGTSASATTTPHTLPDTPLSSAGATYYFLAGSPQNVSVHVFGGRMGTVIRYKLAYL